MRRTVKFHPIGLKIEVEEGTSIFDAAKLLGNDLGAWGIRTVCGSRGTCGQCAVRVLDGGVSGADEGEYELIARKGRAREEGWRLACRTRVLGDVQVVLERVAGGDRLQTAGVWESVEPWPPVQWVPFEMRPPRLGEDRGDADRLA